MADTIKEPLFEDGTIEPTRGILSETFADQSQAIFAIDSMDSLIWYLRKLGNLEAERARIKAQYAAMIAQVDTDMKSLTGRFGQEAELFTAEELVRQGGKRKSLTTLQGTCSFRTVPASLRLIDGAIALKTAVEGQWDDMLVPQLDTTAYRAYAARQLEETGELIPGMEQVEARQSFSVSFKGDPGF